MKAKGTSHAPEFAGFSLFFKQKTRLWHFQGEFRVSVKFNYGNGIIIELNCPGTVME